MRTVGGAFWEGDPGVDIAIGLSVDRFCSEEIGKVYPSIGFTLNGAEVEFDGLSTRGCSEVIVTMICTSFGRLGKGDRAPNQRKSDRACE